MVDRSAALATLSHMTKGRLLKILGAIFTHFTSFVAAEETRVIEGGNPTCAQGLGAGMGGGFGLIPSMSQKPCNMRDRLKRLQHNGGKPEIDEAVTKALDRLKQQQNEDGSWGEGHKVALTSSVLRAYHAQCQTLLSEKHGDVVLKGIVYLINRAVQDNGHLIDAPKIPDCAHCHALGTLCLAEAGVYAKWIAYEIPDLNTTILKAGQLIIDRQTNSGAWEIPGMEETQDPAAVEAARIRMVCFNLQALQACCITGLEFKGMKPCVSKALEFLATKQNADGSIGKGVGIAPLAASVAYVYQLFDKGKNKVPGKAVGYFTKTPWTHWDSPDLDLLLLPAAALAASNHGGKEWDAFNSVFLPDLLQAQEKDGFFKATGAELSDKGAGSPDLASGKEKDARLLRTCYGTLGLEVYYRYLPVSGIALPPDP